MNIDDFTRLFDELEAAPDAETSLLVTRENGQYQIVVNASGDLFRVFSDDYLDAVVQARRVLADQRGEALDGIEDEASDEPAEVVDISKHRRRRRRPPSRPWGGGDAA